jgi:NADH:ubiquinone oxidoreductase subunit F (NADH-binding)
MEPVKLIAESDLSYFIKPTTIEDVETFMNSAIMVRKHIDILNSQRDKKYGVKLFDSPLEGSSCYKVSSNQIGVEAIRNLCNKHRIENGGSESLDSIYICFYSEKEK